MNDNQICAYCDEIRETTLKQLYKIQNQRKEISTLHKKCKSQQAEIERLTTAYPKTIESIKKMYATAKTEAAKELLDKLIKEYGHHTLNEEISIDAIFCSIKHIVKEMAGAESG